MAQNYTYDKGWTVQDFLNAGGVQGASGSLIFPNADMTQDIGMAGYANTPREIYGGKTPLQYLQSLGINDPLNNLNTPVPDDKSGFSGMADFGWMLPLGAAAAAFLGAGALGGMAGAEGAAAGGLAGGEGVLGLGTNELAAGLAASELPGGFVGGGLAGTGAFDMGGSAGVFDSAGNPLYQSPELAGGSWGVNPNMPTGSGFNGLGTDETNLADLAQGEVPGGGSAGDSGFMDWLAKISPGTWLSVGGSLLGSGLGYLGATKAADAQRESANQAQNTIWNMYQQNRADLEPWRTAGVGALGTLTNLTTPGKQLDTAMLDPGYGFGLSEGLKAGDARLRAMGMADSGAAVKAATRFGNDYATQGFNNVYNRLANLAGLGQVGTTAGIAAGSNAANNVANLQTQAGNARASGYMGGANAISGGIGQGINLYNQLAILDAIRGT